MEKKDPPIVRRREARYRDPTPQFLTTFFFLSRLQGSRRCKSIPLFEVPAPPSTVSLTSDPRFPSESFENFRRRSEYRVALNMNKRFMRTKWLQGACARRRWYPNKSRSTEIGVDFFSIVRIRARDRDPVSRCCTIINRRCATHVRTSLKLSSLSSQRVIIPGQ